MPVFRDDDEERLARIEHLLDLANRTREAAVEGLEHAERAVKSAEAALTRVERARSAYRKRFRARHK